MESVGLGGSVGSRSRI